MTMEIERPKVQDCQQAPAQPRGDQSYKQKWNYDDIPDLNRLKTTDPATSSQQKAKRQRKGFAGGVVAEQTTTKRPTRARRQPNEAAPFLSIGNVTNNNNEQAAVETKQRLQQSSVPRGVKVPHNTPSRLSNTPSGLGNVRTRSAGRPKSTNSCWNNLVPNKYKNLSSMPDFTPNENKLTRSPFKQSRTAQSDTMQHPWEPAQTLKEKTMLATYHVARMIAKQAAQPEKTIKGKLVKARLQPLVPVHVEGPTIDQCQGIMAGTMGISEWTADNIGGTKPTRKKKLSPPTLPLQEPYIWDDVAAPSSHDSQRLGSRTLQRRRHIMAMMSHDFLYERPQTGESIHCTSIASDLTENRDSELKSDFEKLDGSGTDSEHAVNATDTSQSADAVHRTSRPKIHSASLRPSPDYEDPLAGKCREGRRGEDGKITVVPGVDDCASPEAQDGGNKDVETETGKHSELLKLAEGDRERAQDSVQYPAPGKHQQRLAAMERPQSVPQKAVHFLDDEPTAEDRVVPRSKSAHPRIAGRIRSNSREGSLKENGSGRRSGSGRMRKPAATECKAEGLSDECGNEKDRDDDREEGKGGAAPMRSCTGVGERGGESSGNRGATDTGGSDDRGGQGKQQSLGLQKDIVIRDSVGGVHTRRGSQLVGDARGVLVVVSKTAPSRGKYHTRNSDGKPRNDIAKVARNDRAKTAGSAQTVARKNAGVTRPHTAHGSSLILDLEFTRDPREEIVAHGDVCFAGSELAATRTKTAAQPVAKTTKHLGDNITDGSSTADNIKVGVCSGCSKVSMLIKSGAVANGRQELCCNCLLKVNVGKAQTPETSEVGGNQNLRNATGNDKHKTHGDATAELTSNDSDYGSNSDENAFMTCFSDLEASMLLARQEIRAEMAETNTDQSLVPVDEANGDDSESDDSEGSFKESSDEGTGDEIVEILARCFEECISITGSVGAISEYLTNNEFYKSTKAKHRISESAPVHKVHAKQSGQSSATTSERSESLRKDVRSGDVTNYEVMLMKGYSANVDITADDAGGDTPFLELMCRCLPEPAKIPETVSLDRAPDMKRLSIKAHVMPLSKPRNQPCLQDPVAQYPPVCFRVNARPPDHHLYYFAYGMDMNPDRFSTYIKRDVDSRLWGLLFGFQLKFNKAGADAGGGCFPNIEFNPYSSVEGCLYVITEDELQVLDKCLGYPEDLERVVLPVWMLNCEEPDELGIAQYCVAALTYIARDQRTLQDESPELCSDYALDQCLRCSDLLTPAYREHLRCKGPSTVATA